MEINIACNNNTETNPQNTNRPIPPIPPPVPLQPQVSIDAVYSEKYEEMRRFRDYELKFSSLFMTFITGLILIILYKYNLSVEIASIVILFTFIICVIICYLVLYAHKRYKQLRNYTTTHLEPRNNPFVPGRLIIGPVYIVIFFNLLLFSIILIIFLFNYSLIS